MRHIPLKSRLEAEAKAKAPNLSASAQKPLPRLRVTLPLRLLTPIIGGGVRPMEPDRAQPVRVTALRGALRWWWRVLQATTSLEELHANERLLFGGVSRPGDNDNVPSLVRVGVRVAPESLVLKVAGYHHTKAQGLRPAARWEIGDDLGYALFPLQLPNAELTGQTKKPTKEVITALEFDLSVELDREGLRRRVQAQADAAVEAAKTPGRPRWELTEAEAAALPEQVTARAEALATSAVEALRWWLHWGGVGARTRRGFGAVALRDPEDTPVVVTGGGGLITPDLLAEPPPLPKLTAGQVRPDDRPTLFGASVLRDLPPTGLGNPGDAHGVLIYALRNTRQGPGYARGPGQDNRPGTTRWPEAELMKFKLADGQRFNHPQNVPEGDREQLRAPRAAFGLPINISFKFADALDKQADGQLHPDVRLSDGSRVDTDRWASPVLLRPQRLMTGQIAASVLILAGAAVPAQVEIVSAPTNGKRSAGICGVDGRVGARSDIQTDLKKAESYALRALFNRLREEHGFKHVDGAVPQRP